MRKQSFIITTTSVVIGLGANTAAWAEGVKTIKNTSAPAMARSAADYAQAKPIQPLVTVLPASITDFNAALAQAAQGTSAIVGAPGIGTQKADALARELTVPASIQAEPVAPTAVGSSGMHFTSSRVAPKTIDKSYPIRTVGKLYFTDGVYNYMCTGSMIKPGVVVTAGHCVHSGNGASSGWYSGFEFIPAYRRVGSKITMPYGSWTDWASVTTSTTWYSGGGSVPNAGDFAVVIFNANSSGYRIGDYTGWLGWGTDLNIGRHITALGYPANLDSAGQLHRVDSMSTNGGTGNGAWGSDMRGGSSGGPIVLNWRVDYSDSSTKPSENWGNIITSVTSWGYVSTEPKVQGGTVFNSTFSSIMTYVCSNYAWAC